MCPQNVIGGAARSRSTPIGVAGRGIVGGLAGTFLLSVLARVLPGMRVNSEQARAVAARNPSGSTLAPALEIPQSPGPEGLAEQFAYKVASGVFGRDLSSSTRLAGRVVHLAYGSGWGMVYGLWQGSYPVSPLLAGPLYGVAVWAVGPGLLVPSMRLIEWPSTLPRDRTIELVTGHVAYGLALALTFDVLERKAR